MRTLTRRGPFLDAVAVDALRGVRTTQIDLCGLPNPEPVLALAHEAETLAPGKQLEVLTDDPCAGVDFVRWLAGADIELVETRCLPERVTGYLFRRPSIATPRRPTRHASAIPRRPRQSRPAKRGMRNRVRTTDPVAT